jgi:hypothetical protein
MYRGRRNRKSGRYTPPRGIRLPRRMTFEPTLPTASGVPVRSRYEQRCADFLFAHKITFQYEPLMLVGGRKYRPDFFLPEYNLFLEICGYGHQPYYRDRVRRKKLVYQKHKLKTVFIAYDGRGSLESFIKEALEPYGVPFTGESQSPS